MQRSLSPLPQKVIIILPVLSFIRSLSYSNIPAEPSISA